MLTLLLGLSFWYFLFGTFDPFLSNGLDTDWSVKRLLGLMLGLIVPF